MFQIKAVSTLTGLNTETLRAWERRYAAVTPQRDSNGRRLYSEQDIERLTLLYEVTKKGHSIGKISTLKNVELTNLLTDNIAPTQLDSNTFYVRVVEALSNYQLDKCEELLRRAVIGMEPLSFARDLIMPALIKVGEMWHDGKITIVQEHLFSNCVRRIVFSLVHNMQTFSGNKKKIMFATLSGEQHEFGILLSYLIAAHQGCTCYYVGTELPAEEIIKIQHQLQADVMVLSLINYPPSDSIQQQLVQVIQECRKGNNMWIGGTGAETLTQHAKFENKFRLIKDLDEINALIKVLKLEQQNGTLLS